MENMQIPWPRGSQARSSGATGWKHEVNVARAKRLDPFAFGGATGTHRRAGDTAAEEILDAAAELFSSRGYAGTSTRAIAEAVGIRQASLYHHFTTKDLILCTLLESTVQGPLAMAREIAGSGRDPLDALLTLARSDAEQLLSSTFNVGALYHLPEVSGEAFAALMDVR